MTHKELTGEDPVDMFGGDAENICEELNEGCGKEIIKTFTSIFGTSEFIDAKCGDYFDGKKEYCDKCKKMYEKTLQNPH